MASLSDVVNDNLRTLLALGVVAVAYVKFGGGSLPTLPGWAPLVGIAAVAVGIVGVGAAGAFEKLFPDDHGIYLVCLNAARTDIVQVWELTEDTFEDLTVANGQLNHLSEAKHRAYEATAYDAETNTARATWRESARESELIGVESVDAVLEQITDLREDLEPEARYQRAIRRRLPSILRRMDADRAIDQERALSPHLSPKMLDDDETIDDIMTDELPDDVLPDRLQNSGKGPEDERTDEPDSIRDALDASDLDDVAGEAVDVPVADGGENE